MLGAGFFTSQKSKEVVHTGVDQATSSIQPAGDTVGKGSGSYLDTVILTLSLTAGNNPVDMTKVLVSYSTATHFEDNIYNGSLNATDGYSWVVAGNSDNLLEKNEKVQLNLPLPSAARISPVTGAAYGVEERPIANEKVTLTVKPSTGATMTMSFTVPPTISAVMTLV
jgi:flagellin FlaB